ncbi:hypothetical protein KGF54_003525 [Candida jiufengensis]|uniref:uncharacterized protein n=1 Tax=Candida jiufengensis TaxID=497108 RepID=UPI002224E011|nr:uncharacterized protein KGF54_003525 [Candida jiufengensis]KAI5952658.1 hypothetical protein KGF54_003525 [Candida jiufengensis]
MSISTTLNLPYTFKIDPKVTKNSVQTYYETSIGLWRNHFNETNGETYNIMDNLTVLQAKCNQLNQLSNNRNNHIELINPSMQNQMINIIINGDSQYQTDIKSQILYNFNSIISKTITIDNSEFLLINEKFINQMNKLCERYQVEVILNNDKLSFDNTTKSEIAYSLHMIGNQDNVTISETSLKILIDSYLSNYNIDSFQIPLSLIPLIGGTNLNNFKKIAKQTNSIIYIPDLLPNLYNSEILTNNYDMSIWITSKNLIDLSLTKTILEKLNNNKVSLITKKITMNQSKIDLIIMNNQKELINLMLKHGTFMQFPSLGESNNSTIIVQGSKVETIDECITELCLIAAQYYTITGITTHQQEIIQMCQYTKTCTVTTKDTSFKIIGHNKEIKQLLNKLAQFSTNLNIQLELTNDQKEFISGKKNGKLIKILNQLNNIPTIYFTPYNEFSFNIDINTSSTYILPQAIELIELELPSELKFNIPEVFHKSIIGNGGSMIQSIMKKYNVFIKLSSITADVSSNLNFCFQRNSNVLIKCPRKNMSNIPLVKNEIDNLVSKYCINEVQQQNVTLYYNIKFQILKNQYLSLLSNNKLNLINNLESEYNSFIDFPNSIDNFDSNVLEFNIKGSELKIKNCAKALQDLLPQCYEFKFTSSFNKFNEVFGINNQEDFKNHILIPFKLLLGYDLIVNEHPIDSGLSYHQIILSYYDNEPITKLNNAIESLTYWLRNKGFSVIEMSNYIFNSILNTSLSSPIKIQRFTSNLNQQSMPLQLITNLNNGSPIKNQVNLESCGSNSATKHYIVSPSRQQLMMSSPIKNYQQSYYSNVSQPSSPQKQFYYNSSSPSTVDQSFFNSPSKYHHHHYYQNQQQFLNSPVKLKPFDYNQQGVNNFVYNV